MAKEYMYVCALYFYKTTRIQSWELHPPDLLLPILPQNQVNTAHVELEETLGSHKLQCLHHAPSVLWCLELLHSGSWCLQPLYCFLMFPSLPGVCHLFKLWQSIF